MKEFLVFPFRMLLRLIKLLTLPLSLIIYVLGAVCGFVAFFFVRGFSNSFILAEHQCPEVDNEEIDVNEQS